MASLRDATDAFVASEFARKTFGDDVVDHYGHFFRTEYAAYSSAVTDWSAGATSSAYDQRHTPGAARLPAPAAELDASRSCGPSEGASIVAVDIDQAAAQHTVDAVQAAGGRAAAVQADVARGQDCERMIAAAERVRDAEHPVQQRRHHAQPGRRRGVDDEAV